MPPPEANGKSGIGVRFWGVRGSIPTARLETARAGGHTACVEVRCGGHVLIFDAGSGLVPAGLALAAEGVVASDIFLSHSHYDHLIGLPFFPLLSRPESRCRIWSGHLDNGMTTREMIGDFMRPPFFPATIDSYAAAVGYRDFRAGESFSPYPGIVIDTVRLSHPGGVVAYAVTHAGRKLAYVTDFEHDPALDDSDLAGFVADADLLIYDGMYSDDEFPARRGFGHSTWQQGVRLARHAGVHRLALFHHSPLRSDDDLDRLETCAASAYGNAFTAREGLSLQL